MLGLTRNENLPIEGAECPFHGADGRCRKAVFVYKDQTQVICPDGHRSPRSAVVSIPDEPPAPGPPPRRPIPAAKIGLGVTLAALVVDALLRHL